MLTELHKRWIRALRSGRYEQTQGTLSRFVSRKTGRTLKRRGVPAAKEKNCCLGVACRVAGLRREWTEEDWKRPDPHHSWRNETTLSSFGDGGKLMQRLDMTSEDESKLAELNDSGVSFAEIADWIEARWTKGEDIANALLEQAEKTPDEVAS